MAYLSRLLVCAIWLSVTLIASQYAASAQTAIITIVNADTGEPVSMESVEVKLFPPEHGDRKFLSQLCIPLDSVQPLMTFALTTDATGSFLLRAPGGDYLVELTIPHRQPIFGCVLIDTDESVRACGGRRGQRFFVRTISTIPEFSGDILASSGCAQWVPSACDPLRAPNQVIKQRIELLDSLGKPIGNARLEFRQNSKAIGKPAGTVTTNGAGVADLSALPEAGGLFQLSIDSKATAGAFLIQLAGARVPGQQTLRLFDWRCQGAVLHGAIVQP